IPDQTYHQLPPAGAVFAFSSPGLVPRPQAGVPVIVREPDVPDDVLADADAGVQLAAHLGGWDVTLNYLYHYHDSPVIVADASDDGVIAETRYRRTSTVGGTLANAFGDFTLRAEGGYSTARYFPTRRHALADGVD